MVQCKQHIYMGGDPLAAVDEEPHWSTHRGTLRSAPRDGAVMQRIQAIAFAHSQKKFCV